MNNDKVGWLLMNTGTPTEPTIEGLKKYYKEFLSDPKVIDIHPLVRSAIVNLFILPFRPKRILPQYQGIWLDQGSPLLVHSKNLLAKLRTRNPDIKFELGMRYGSPSISDGLLNLQSYGVDKIVLAPMFPQYAEATTGSCIENAIGSMKQLGIDLPFKSNYYFYQESFFLKSLAESIENSSSYHESDFLLFSFHGLPERHVKKMDVSGEFCLKNDKCCEGLSNYNEFCSRYHSNEIVRKIVTSLKPDKPYSISFQSRFGLEPWLKPNTMSVLRALPKTGIKKLSVACPSFIFDCLETLEEIAIKGKEVFIKAGGESLELIPALNDSDQWADNLSNYINSKSI